MQTAITADKYDRSNPIPSFQKQPAPNRIQNPTQSHPQTQTQSKPDPASATPADRFTQALQEIRTSNRYIRKTPGIFSPIIRKS